MLIDFEEKDHVYSINGDIASISVTELLKKHNIAPDYNGVSNATLKNASKKGKEVHKDLENILNTKDYEPKTEQGKNFAKWVKENLDCGVAEQMLGYRYNEMLIAGTADVMGFLKDGTPIVADHKNTSQFHREYVTWQVNLLDFFARRIANEKINGKILNWKGAKKFYCFHYDPKSGELTVHELEKIDDEEILELLMCEYKNEIYQRKSLVIEKELALELEKIERFIAKVEKQKKNAEIREKELRQQLQQAMEKQGIKAWESPSKRVTATYIYDRDDLVLDAVKVKERYPQVYADCLKAKHTKAFVKIKVKEKNENDKD